MATELITGVGLFKTLLDTATGLMNVKDTAQLNAAVIKLQEQILAAQAAQMELLQQKTELETALKEIQDWDNEKQRYQLQELQPGNYAYVIRDDARATTEPVHYLCTTCFEDNKKSLLQGRTYGSGQRNLACPVCGTKVTHSIGPRPEVLTIPSLRRF